MAVQARWIVQTFASGWGDDRPTKLPMVLAKLEDDGYEIVTVSPICRSCDALIVAKLKGEK